MRFNKIIIVFMRKHIIKIIKFAEVFQYTTQTLPLKI